MGVELTLIVTSDQSVLVTCSCNASIPAAIHQRVHIASKGNGGDESFGFGACGVICAERGPPGIAASCNQGCPATAVHFLVPW